MLDRLERADRAAELHTHLGVLDSHLEDHLCATDLLGCEADCSEVEHPLQDLPAAAVGADERSLHAIEFELRLLAGLIHCRQCGLSEARSVAVDSKQAGACCGLRGDDDQVSGVAVEHEAFGAGDLAVSVSGGLDA